MTSQKTAFFIATVVKTSNIVTFEVFTAVTIKNGMLRRVALVRTDVSEELSSSFIRVTRNGELGTTLAVTSMYNNKDDYYYW
jgi:hypothetical protein